LENTKDKDRVYKVKNYIDSMDHTGVYPEKIYIDHVRDPREWVPICGMKACKGPFDTLQGQSLTDKLIGVNVEIIVKINKIKTNDLSEDNKTNESKRYKNKRIRQRQR
jgi:hypothetical protein